MSKNRAKAVCLWGFLYNMCLKSGGTPLQKGYEWHWRGMRMVLEELGDAPYNLIYMQDTLYRVFLLIVVGDIDRDETQFLWV